MTRNVRLARRAVAVLAVALGACGGDDGGDGAPAGTTVDPASAESTVAPAATGPGATDEGATEGCPLTTDEVASVIDGELIDMGCGWTGDTADVFVSDYPGELWAGYRSQAESDLTVTPVPQFGDDAYLVESGPLHVLVGDVAYDVMVHATDPALDADAAKRALADIIVAKVGS